MHRLQLKTTGNGVEVMLDGKVVREVVRVVVTSEAADAVRAIITLNVDPNIDVLSDVTLDEVFPTPVDGKPV